MPWECQLTEYWLRFYGPRVLVISFFLFCFLFSYVNVFRIKKSGSILQTKGFVMEFKIGPIWLFLNSGGIEQKRIAFYYRYIWGTSSEAKPNSSPLFEKLSAQQWSRTRGWAAQFLSLVKSFLTGVPQGKIDRRRTLGTSLRCCARNAIFHWCTPRQNWRPLCGEHNSKTNYPLMSHSDHISLNTTSGLSPFLF